MSQVPVVGESCGGHSSGMRCWCLRGLWTEMEGVCGALNRLLHVWVMYGMVMDEKQHVFPGVWVRQSFPVC